MNLDKLRRAEAGFLAIYPKGFADPAIQPVRRKHNVQQLVRYAGEALTRERCHRPDAVCDAVLAIISRSSMVARFDKPRFRDFVASLGGDERETFAYAVEQRLHGRRAQGFELMRGMLAPFGLARWPVISAAPFYHAPRREAFVKPSTVKRILAWLEVEDLRYHPTPSWAFYRGFQRLLVAIRREVSPSLSPTNAALTGFLMMSLTADGTQADMHARHRAGRGGSA